MNFEIIQKNILYEDNHLLIVKKECGILSQPDITNTPDLFSLCKNYIKIRYSKPGNVYLGLIHRLDRNVSGITVFAKTSKAAKRMSEIFQSRKVRKIYRAVAEGKIHPAESRLTDTIQKDEKSRTAYTSPSGGQTAELSYRTLQNGNTDSGDAVSLLEIELFTGRFHQIRFQLSSRGFPVFGDEKYGSKFPGENSCIFLHASRIEFEHPVKKTPLAVDCPHPESWNRFFERRSHA